MLIPIIQIILSVVLIILILLQERSSGLSGVLGGGGDGSVYQTRRGLERFIFIATIIIVVIFIGLSIFQLV